MRIHRSYGLFKRLRGTKKWERVGVSGYRKETAVRVFQNHLLAPYLNPDEAKFEYSLRVVKP